MKKIIIIVCTLCCFLFSGCSKYDTVEIRLSRGDWTVLSRSEAEKAWEIIQKFEKGNYPEISPAEYTKGGLDFYIRVTCRGNQTVYDTRGPEWAIADPDQTYHQYKVGNDLYNDLAVFYEKYYPLLYSMEYSPAEPMIYGQHDGRYQPDQESIIRLYGEIRDTIWRYPDREEYSGSYDDEICRIEYDDSVIKETIHLFDEYKVINGRKMPVNDPELIRFILPDTEIPDAGSYMSDHYMLVLRENRSGVLRTADMEYDIRLDISRQVITGLDGDIPYRYKDRIISFDAIGGRVYLRKVEGTKSRP